jgi:hypothetical protein
VPASIVSLDMGFSPVPRLSDKEPSTSYIVRGKNLYINPLTPDRRGTTARFLFAARMLSPPRTCTKVTLVEPRGLLVTKVEVDCRQDWIEL